MSYCSYLFCSFYLTTLVYIFASVIHQCTANNDSTRLVRLSVASGDDVDMYLMLCICFVYSISDDGCSPTSNDDSPASLLSFAGRCVQHVFVYVYCAE